MATNEPIKETAIQQAPNVVEKSYDSPTKFPEVISSVSASDMIAQMVNPTTSTSSDHASE